MADIKKALVCGAGGFIGSHMVRRLRSEGYWVRGVDQKYPEFSETEAHDFVKGDLREVSLVKDILGFSLGLGGIAVTGAVLYMLFGLTSWKDYEDKVSWGVIVLYAGCISLGSVFKVTGASSWFADQIMMLVAPLGLNSGVGLVILMCFIGAVLTNLMSAGATVAVIGPVVLDMAISSGTNPVLVGVGLAIATSMAYWLVIGTPASSIVYASGQLESKDFIRMATLGWPAALLALSAIIILWWVNILGINPSGMGF